MKVLDYEKLVHTYAGLAARYFLDYIALVEKCQEGVEDVEKEAERIRRSSAQQLGESLATKATRRDLNELRELYWSKFPNVKIVELQSDYMVARAHKCAFCQGLRSLGVDPARMKELSHLACLPDEAAASGFNPAIRLRLETRQMEGDSYCEWILNLQKEAEEELPSRQPSPTSTHINATAGANPKDTEDEPVRVLNEDFEKYVPSFIESRALYFLDYVDFTEAYHKNPRKLPMKLARQVRYDSAYRQGARLVEQAGDRALEKFIERYWHRMPYTETVELSSDRAVVRADRDPFYEAFQQLGVSKDRIKEFSDLFFVVEEGATKGFNLNIEFRRRKHLMIGDAYSEWEFRLPQVNSVAG